MVITGLVLACLLLPTQDPEYTTEDPDLKVVRLDSTPSDSYLAVRLDTMGRIFVGGRDRLYVYEPDDRGGYAPRRKVFDFPNNSWIYDIEVRGDDLYVMTVRALYVIPGGVIRREGLQARRLIWGVPMAQLDWGVHQGLHGLAWGPEGNLYFSMGDPNVSYGDFRSRFDHWAHWSFQAQPEGTSVPFTGVGAFFRCRPDGSRLEGVANGTRNSVGITFDAQWNLFGSDNDHESKPNDFVPGRLLYVTPHADFSWPRGWMVERTPDRLDLLETMFGGMGRAVPVGMAVYDENYFSKKYRENLLMARWCTREVVRYPLKRQGAGFVSSEERLLVGKGRARPVGVAVGRGGRVFVTIAYMETNDSSPVYKSDLVMITRADDPGAYPFDPYEATTATPERLWKEVSDPSWHRRRAAHGELLRRGGDALAKAAQALASATPGDPGIPCLVWLAGASGTSEAARILSSLAGNSNPEVRFQAVRALAEFPSLAATVDLFAKFLEDPSLPVRQAALVALFDRAGGPSLTTLARLAADTDPRLRQTAARLLSRRASMEDLRALSSSGNAEIRLAGTLAAGFRLTVREMDAEVPEPLPLKAFPEEGLRPEYVGGRVDLRPFGRAGMFTLAEHWKSKAPTPDEEALFQILLGRLGDSEGRIRLQAASFLYLLNDPRSEPEIARVRRAWVESGLAALPERPLGQFWILGPLPPTTRLAEGAPVDLSRGDWKKGDSSAPPGSEGSLFYYYVRLETPRREKALLKLDPPGAEAVINGESAGSGRVILGLQAGGNDLLLRVPGGSPQVVLHAPPAVLPVLPEKPEGRVSLAERLRNAGSDPAVSPEFLKVDWKEEVPKGSAEKGRKLFGSLGCVKCHAITPDGSSGGAPSLAEARRRFTLEYLVESVLYPSRSVSPAFRATIFKLKSGDTLSGLVVGETGDQVEVLASDATRRTIRTAEIEGRKLSELSPMPPGLVKTPEELRDLLRYLLSEKPLPP
jgi:putative heme-binding domain-containing protein